MSSFGALTEVRKELCCWPVFISFGRCHLSSFETQQNPPCSLRMFAGMLFSTAQQFSTDQLDSFADRLCFHILFSGMAHLVIARLRLLLPYCSNSPSLFAIHCLQHRFVLLVTPFAPDSGFVSSYCSPVVFQPSLILVKPFFLFTPVSALKHVFLS